MCRYEAKLREGKVKKGGLNQHPVNPRPGPPPGQGSGNARRDPCCVQTEHADDIPVEIMTDDERKLRFLLSKTASEEIQTVEPERTHIKCGSFEFISDGVCNGRVLIDGHVMPRVRKVVLNADVECAALVELHMWAVSDTKGK